MRDVACVGRVGSGGCGFEHQLEAPFKALSPMVQPDANLGFLCNDAYDGLSTIAILVVTDEDDCSLSSTEPWKANAVTAPPDADPSCHAHKQWLHDVTRYYAEFRKLRAGREELVLFMAMANGSTLEEMFCHATEGTCVRGCVSDADCSQGWGCDARLQSIASGGNHGAYCINVACGRPD